MHNNGIQIFLHPVSLRSWRYCVGARLKFGQRSRVPKKGSRDEAVEIPPARKPRYFEWSAHQCAGKRIGRGPYICQSCQSLKHFTTASEIKSYQEHLQKNKPPEMVTQYACNKPAS